MPDDAGRHLNALHVVQGATGGIGRVEALLSQVWASDDRLVVTTVRRDFAQITLPPGTRRGRVRARIAWITRVLGVVVRKRVDVVLLGHLNLAPFAAISHAVHPTTRVVLWAYGAESWRAPSPLTRAGLRFVDQVWSISEHTARRFSAASGFPRDRVVVVPLALQPALASALSRRPGSSNRSASEILTVSRLWRGDAKGIDHLIAAIARTPSQVRLTIVGEGDDRPRLEAIARDAGVSARVTFTGRIDDARLTQLYRECSIFALPSEREGFGLVFLEAMAAGKPVIAARSAAVPEVVQDGATGLLVPFGDRDALATAINRLIADPATASRLGDRGRTRALQDFAFSRFAARVADLLVAVRDREPLPAGTTG